LCEPQSGEIEFMNAHIYIINTVQTLLTIPASGACPTNSPRLTKYMTVAIKDSDMLMQHTESTHLSPESRLDLATVVVTLAKHTAEKIDSAIHTGKRFADMSVLISISMRVDMMGYTVCVLYCVLYAMC
jgi:hypothetical protein